MIERIIGPLPGEREARAFSIAAIAVALIACALSLYYGFRGETFLGRPLGSDFVQFYAVGKILNQGDATKIFDVPYLAQVEHESLPSMPKTQMLIFGNAPSIGAIFRTFALMSYEHAYCVWLIFSAAIYLAGSLFLMRGNRTWLLLAVATPMFTLETWIGGQISILAFCAFAVSARWFEEQKFFLAGIALGFAAYKPSLIAIPFAMLLFGRCWAMLAGLIVSAAGVALASFATVGAQGMWLWVETMRVFRYLAMDQESVLRRSKYVDLNSFLTGLFGPHEIVTIVGYAVVALALLVLSWTWFQARGGNLLCAATIAAVLTLNVYVPVYDTIILIPALVLAARTSVSPTLRSGLIEKLDSAMSPNREGGDFQKWVLAFVLVPWLTQSAADFLRVQILTLVIAGFGYWAWMGNAVISRRELAADSPNREGS